MRPIRVLAGFDRDQGFSMQSPALNSSIELEVSVQSTDLNSSIEEVERVKLSDKPGRLYV